LGILLHKIVLQSWQDWSKSSNKNHSNLSTNFEPYSQVVAFLKMFCFSDTRFDGHNVAAIFGKQRSLPLGFADPNMYRDHASTIGHES
jgi:hypothetical protein